MEASTALNTDRGVPDGDDILGRAVRFLIDGGEEKAAAILVESRLDIIVHRVVEPAEPWQPWAFVVTYVVETSRAGYEALRERQVLSLNDEVHMAGSAIRDALCAVTFPNIDVNSITARFDQTPAVEGWRDDVAAFVLVD
jgi:hypothetical protein